MAINDVLVGDLLYVQIANLRLDPNNPRLPPAYQGGTQEQLAEILEIGFEAILVAESMAVSGYFHEEPLLVIDGTSEGYEAGTFVVVEGNRRLTALLGLTRGDVRSRFSSAEKWDLAAERSRIVSSTEIPVVLHPNRHSTYRQVARAHVIGKLGWQPRSQALFIANRVDEGQSFESVAELLGLKKAKVADMYRDQAVVKQMADIGIDTKPIENSFSSITVAMSSTKIRDFIGAPLGTQLSPGSDPIPLEKIGALKETVEWIFGSDDVDPVITDTRQISKLGNVIASEVGLNALRSGESLDAAYEKVKSAGMDPLDRLLNRLTAAKSALLSASDDLGEFANDQSVIALLEDLDAVIDGLRTLSMD
jgi:hypothetical protein